MTLAEAKIGEIVEVHAISGERSFRRRLMELGLVPKTRITFLGVAPLGDPLHLLVRGCQLSIRRNEAAQIRVSLTESASLSGALVPGQAVSA